MAIKVGEVYIEVFPKVNAAARKAASADIAADFERAFSNAYRNVSNDDTQFQHQRVVRSRSTSGDLKTDIGDVDRSFSGLFKKLRQDGNNTESIFHKMATGMRTVGTILRGLSLGTAVIAGSRLLLVAFQGLAAVLPLVQAGLVATPA